MDGMRVPTVSTQAEPMQRFDAPVVKNFAPEQTRAAGQAMLQAGTVATQIQQEYQDQIDTARTKEIDNQLADLIRGTLSDPENGYLAKSRKAAIDSRKDVVKQLQEGVKGLEQNLENEIQRYMFKKAATARIQAAMQQVDGHALNQAKVYRSAETKARLDGARRDAISSWAGWETQDGLFGQSKRLMLQETEALIDDLGLGRDSAQAKQLRQAATTQLHMDVLDTMVSKGYTTEAKKYLAAAGKSDEILPDKLDELQTKVKVAGIATEADNLATKVWGEFAPQDRNGAVPIFQMEQKARELAGENEEVQKAAIAGIRERANGWNVEQAEFKAQNVSGVWRQIDSGAPMKKVQLSPEWLALTDTERRQIRRDLETEQATLASRQASEAARADAELARKERMLLLRNGDEYLTATDPEVLKKMTRAQVEALRGKFGLQATQHLLEKWDAIQNPAKYQEAKIEADMFNAVASELGMDPLSKNKSEKAKIGTLRFHLEQEIAAEQAVRKSVMTNEEKKAFIRKTVANKVLVQGFWRQYERPIVMLTAEEARKVVVPMPEQRRIAADMAAMYKKTGAPEYAPTRSNLVAWYLRGQGAKGYSEFVEGNE